MSFGTRLRELRIAAGLTQEQLAQRAGLSIGSIRSIEQTELDPKFTTVAKLAHALDVNTDAFLEAESPKPAPAKKPGRGKKPQE